jgi:UDP-glucose 4-epimerase
MRKVLVTGGAGFIGHHLVKVLIEANTNVTIIDNLSNSNKQFLEELENKRHCENVMFHNEDIRNIEAISNIFKEENFDACIHLAAKVSVQDSIIRPFDTIDVNVRGTLNLLEACSNNNVNNFFFASSAAVYGNPRTLPLSEDMAPEPISPYGASKVAGEALVSSYKSKIKNCVNLRFFNVYGEGQNPEYAGVIIKFIDRLSKRLPPLIFGDGQQSRDFISVNDLVDAVILALEKTEDSENYFANISTLNIGTGIRTSVLDLAILMIKIFKLEQSITPSYLDPVRGDIMHSFADITRTRKMLEFTPKEDLKSGITNMVSQTLPGKIK